LANSFFNSDNFFCYNFGGMDSLNALQSSLPPWLAVVATPLGALKVVCAVSSLLLMFSGAFDLLPVVRNKSAGSKSHMPFMAMLLDTFVGLWFSRLINDNIGSALRAVGLFLVLVYIAIMYLYSDNPQRVVRHSLAVIATFGAIAAGLILLVPTREARSNILGMINTATAIGFAASPLTEIGTVLRTRSAASIPQAMVTLLTICASSWAVYGLVLSNVWMVLPNAVNAVLGALQVALTLLYPGRGGVGWDEGPIASRTRRASNAAANAVAAAKAAAGFVDGPSDAGSPLSEARSPLSEIRSPVSASGSDGLRSRHKTG